MGVIACSRTNCRNIMCDIQLTNYNICNECYNEFVSLMGQKTLSRKEMNDAFEEFMESEKQDGFDHEKIDAESFFAPYIRNNW